MWSISVLFCLIRSISVLFGLLLSNSVHFGPFMSNSVLFGPLRSIQSNLVHFGPFGSLSYNSVHFVFFVFFFRSNLVHSGLFSPIRCILILFSLLWSFSVHFDALQYIYIYLEKREGILMFVIASHSMIHCHLDFLVSLWVPPVQSKVCHYSTSLL